MKLLISDPVVHASQSEDLITSVTSDKEQGHLSLVLDSRDLEKPSQSEVVKDCDVTASIESVEQSVVSAMRGLGGGTDNSMSTNLSYFPKKTALGNTERAPSDVLVDGEPSSILSIEYNQNTGHVSLLPKWPEISKIVDIILKRLLRMSTRQLAVANLQDL